MMRHLSDVALQVVLKMYDKMETGMETASCSQLYKVIEQMVNESSDCRDHRTVCRLRKGMGTMDPSLCLEYKARKAQLH